jgi:hypothetical protein
MSSAPDLESYLATITHARQLLGGAELAPRSEEPVRVTFERSKTEMHRAGEAEDVLTRGLATFPLHPYLLAWRANARCRIALGGLQVSEDALVIPDASAAVSDLKLAAEVAPDYLEPRIDLAFHTLNYADDAAGASDQFRWLVSKLADRLVDCAAGLVESLRETGAEREADAELAKWRSAFPNSTRLDALRSNDPGEPVADR